MGMSDNGSGQLADKQQEGDEGCQEHHYEEWQARDSGRLPDRRHQGVQPNKHNIPFTLAVCV